MKNKIKYFLYSLTFLALAFPAKAFETQELYGSPRGIPLLYGPPIQPDPWYILCGRYLFIIAIPIIVIILIIIGIRRLVKKKK